MPSTLRPAQLPQVSEVKCRFAVARPEPVLKIAPEAGVAATSMLTLIAFIFATTNMVPKLGYFTRLDKFIVGATFFVFLALLESVLTSVLVSRGFTHRARRVDALCRVVFPLAFVLFGLLAFAG
jgi:hypothetical protein